MRSAGMAMAIPAFAGCTTSTRTNPSPTGVTLPTELSKSRQVGGKVASMIVPPGNWQRPCPPPAIPALGRINRKWHRICPSAPVRLASTLPL